MRGRVDAATRDAAVRAEIAAHGGVVPSVRAMAAALGWSLGSVQTVYRRLGLRASRPAVPKRAYPRLHPAIHPDDYDVLCRVAAIKGTSVTKLAEDIHRDTVARLRVRFPHVTGGA